MGRAQRDRRRRRQAPDLVQRERHVSGEGSVLRPLLPDQLRRHGPDAADTTADANHVVMFSSDRSYYVDTYSRVDLANGIRAAAWQRWLARNARWKRADIAELKKAGWKPPEVFVAKGRDGKTDIWGVIYRPTNFDAAKKYPVIENIYAGPQGSFVPKSFAALQRHAGNRRDRLHRRADRRHGYEQSLEGVPRCRLEEPW